MDSQKGPSPYQRSLRKRFSAYPCIRCSQSKRSLWSLEQFERLFIRTPETTRKAWSVEPLRIAVIGAGYWGKKVIRETLDVGRTTGRVQVHAVVDNSPTMLSHCRNEFGPFDYKLDYHEILADPKPSRNENSSHTVNHRYV